MNLADAIRKAAQEAVQPPPPAPNGFADVPAQSGVMEQKVSWPEPPSVTSGSVVRLELFLNSEQVTSMLKALMAGQHTVLTLREAASYLRVSPSTLADLAEQGEVPAVLLEGRWRFPKSNLDEWLMMQSMKDEQMAEDEQSVA